MYNLPEDFDPTVFVGYELTEVCFSENTVTVAFGQDISVTLLASFVHRLSGSEEDHPETIPLRSSSLMQLTGKTVKSATSKSDGTLVLVFADGQVLMFLDDSSEYESYSIRIGEQEIIV